MESVDDVVLDAAEKMTRSVEILSDQFSGLRTGKASPALVENISVSYYGTPTRLRDIAGISTPEPRLIVINAYDPTALTDIEKAILSANVGVTPMNDGRIIRIPIPELNEERRKDLVKVARRMAEEARVAVRNVRRDANETLKSREKNGQFSEDDRDRGLSEIQEQTDAHTQRIDTCLKQKEIDIMEV